MAANSTTDDTIENQQVGGNDIGVSSNSNDGTVTDTAANQPPRVNLKDFPCPQDMENEKGNSLPLEATEVIKKEVLPPGGHGNNSVQISMQEPENPDIHSKGLADLPEESDCVHSPAAAPTAPPGDTETLDFESSSQKIDGKDLDDPNQEQGSVILKERSLEVKVKPEKAQPQKDGVTGAGLSIEIQNKEMDMDNDLAHLEASSVIQPKEGKLFSEADEIKEKCLSQEMPGLELVSGNERKKEFVSASAEMDVELNNEVEGDFLNPEQSIQPEADMNTATNMFLPGKNAFLGSESETEENQAAFMKELEAFHKERFLEFKPPKFYGEPLNCLKLWRAVIKLGGYEQVTASKLWRQVGESFNPPKTCTTVSWTFRGFYEKALLEYEKHKMRSGDLPFTDASSAEPSGTGNQGGLSQSSGSGRARRDAAARAMQGWHSQRLLGNGEVGDPIIKDKNSVSTPKREKQLKSVGLLKRKKVSPVDHSLHIANLKASKPQLRALDPCACFLYD